VELGWWINTTHQTWRWFYIKETDDLQQLDKNKLHHYQRRAGRTRGTTERYNLDRVRVLCGATTRHTNISHGFILGGNSNNKTIQRNLSLTRSKAPADFWEFLASWGGEWMWEGIDDNQPTKHDLTCWAVEGMKIKTLIWVTDGSYDKLRAADLSGVGWVIFCTKTRKRLTAGWCWEKSNSANTYSFGGTPKARQPLLFCPSVSPSVTLSRAYKWN